MSLFWCCKESPNHQPSTTLTAGMRSLCSCNLNGVVKDYTVHCCKTSSLVSSVNSTFFEKSCYCSRCTFAKVVAIYFLLIRGFSLADFPRRSFYYYLMLVLSILLLKQAKLSKVITQIISQTTECLAKTRQINANRGPKIIFLWLYCARNVLNLIKTDRKLSEFSRWAAL